MANVIFRDKDSAWGFTALTALAVGLMLSPDSLIILGNSIGSLGGVFLILILTALTVHALTALSLAGIFARLPRPEAEAAFIRDTIGFIPAVSLPICSRVLFAICAATGILATAGYTFNESFLHWFPNLGFSFCLLGLLLVLNVFGPRISQICQVFFVSTAVTGLLVLSIIGLFGLGNETAVAHPADVHIVNLGKTLSWGLLLFLGFDLAAFASLNHPSNLAKAMVTGMLIVGIVFCLWGLVSMLYTSPAKLSDSTVPHLISARRVFGQNGRIIMGIVIIFGSCSAVNALLMGVSKMLAGMTKQGLLPSFFGNSGKRLSVPLLFLAGATAAMMAGGYAGEPVLEVYIRAGVWFWLLNYAVIHASILIRRTRADHQSAPIIFPVPGFASLTSLLILIIALVALLWTADNQASILKFMVVLLGSVFVFALICFSLSKRQKHLNSVR